MASYKRKNMTKASYSKIKALLDAGVSQPTTADITKFSAATVHRVAHSKDWADYAVQLAQYAKYRRAYNESRKAKQAQVEAKPPVQEVPISEKPATMNEIVILLTTQNHLLEKNNQLLMRMVELWEEHPKATRKDSSVWDKLLFSQ